MSSAAFFVTFAAAVAFLVLSLVIGLAGLSIAAALRAIARELERRNDDAGIATKDVG